MKKARIKLWIILGVEFLAIIGMICMIYFAGKKEYTVRFELNGGTLVSGEAQQKIEKGKAAKAPTVTKDGYYFVKWSTSYDHVTKDMVVEAIWGNATPEKPTTSPTYETSYGIQFTTEDSQAWNYCEVVSSYEYISGAVYIAAYNGNQKVLGIKEGAFQDRTRITSVYLLDGILTIEDNAFAGCTNLETVVLPTTLMHLGANAFKDCENLKTIVVTDTLEALSREDPEAYKQQMICELPKKLEYIGDGAFSGCDSLQNVYIPESVTTMGHAVFDRMVEEVETENSSAEGNESSQEDSSASSAEEDAPVLERLIIRVYVPVKPEGWAEDWYQGNPEIIWDYLGLSDEDEKLAEQSSSEA